ncbi:MAG TPA: glycosyltransferase [Blastocatellia bacterium]|nr:glycosyltransferase [Blastocatellia bacterium]
MPTKFPPHEAAAGLVRAQLLTELRRQTQADTDSADLNLPFSSFGFDSNAVLELLTRLEDNLNITIRNEEFREENLSTPAALDRLLVSKLIARAPAKPKYIHIAPEFLPRLSGPQREISTFCKQLGQWLDFEVYTYDLDRGLAPEDLIDGIPIKRFSVPRVTDLIRLRRRVRALSGHPGIDPEKDANYALPSSGILSAIQGSSADKLITYFYHNVTSQLVTEFFPSKEWIFIPTFFQAPGGRDDNSQWWDPSRVGRFLYFQEQDFKEALAFGIPLEKLTVMPLPIDTDRFQPADVPRDRDTLLYVGRITANKGIRAFLHTLKWLADRRPTIRLRLVADRDSRSRVEQLELQRLRTAIDRLQLNGRVELAGRKEGQELVREYSSHLIHILPSIGDCYSFATMEALACGMTCVNLDSPHYEWQREMDEGAPLVHLCNSLPAMGEQILRLLETDDLPSHRDYMVRRFSWGVLRDGYREFFIN